MTTSLSETNELISADSSTTNRSSLAQVKLINYFKEPYNNAVATARTCYSSKVIYSEDVRANEERLKQRDRISKSIYKAGHHTTMQHATFQFVLEKVSRQFIWSFLHAHPFYNSEQVSQRYVEVKPNNAYVPDLGKKQTRIYCQALQSQMHDYRQLIDLLMVPTTKQYQKIFPHRDPSLPQWHRAIKKKSMEIARYVLPVATHAHLYHTVSGITVYRYYRLCNQFDVPQETRDVVQAMVHEIRQVDSEFFKNLEDPIPLEETLEHRILQETCQESFPNLKDRKQFIEEFDQSLQDKTSTLIGYNPSAEQNMASAVRTVLGLPQSQLDDETALAKILHPGQNPYLSNFLNLNAMSKLMRVLNHCHFTFRKKISHTADSQDQRHRMTPGSRPILACHFQIDRPDFITPALIELSEPANEIYQRSMLRTWQTIEELLNLGVTLENALYLLPNAFPIRFEESGDLMAFHHKWTTRLCYTAQEEIWNSCRDEVLEVGRVFPLIGRFLHPPCTLRNMAKVTPYCPEGDRYCGVRVWQLEVEAFDRSL